MLPDQTVLLSGAGGGGKLDVCGSTLPVAHPLDVLFDGLLLAYLWLYVVLLAQSNIP